MNTEDFVTYEQAKKLNELGFNCEVNHYYNPRKELCENLADYSAEDIAYGEDTSYEDFNSHEFLGLLCSAPTLSQVAKWLREEKGLYINIWLCAAGYSWNIEKCGDVSCNGTFVVKHDEISGDDEDSGLFTTYEKALSSGITKALEII